MECGQLGDRIKFYEDICRYVYAYEPICQVRAALRII